MENPVVIPWRYVYNIFMASLALQGDGESILIYGCYFENRVLDQERGVTTWILIRRLQKNLE